MRYCKILLFAVIFFLSARVSFAQSVDLEKKITINLRNVSLKVALEEISKQGNIFFSYSNQHIDDNQQISIIARNQALKSVLNKLFGELDIEYIVVEKQIVLKPRKEQFSEQKISMQKYIVSGYLKDAENNEVLIGATIRIAGTNKGTITNAYGFYSMSLPAGNYTLQFSYIGYQTKTITVNLDKDLQLSQKLVLDETDLQMVVVTDKENIDILENNPLKIISLPKSSIKKIIGINGEASVVKTLNSIPGISPYGDGSVLFYVRGGNKDQNLIIVDEAPIYNPSHMLGFFSSIDPDAVNTIKVSKGNFPVQYGGRLSSLIDVRTKDGNMKNFSFFGNISPYTGSLGIEGPFSKEKSSYRLTLRKSTLNWLFNQQPGDLKMDFYDLHLKLNFKINRKNRIYFSLYSGADEVEAFKTGMYTYAMSWENVAATFRWNHLISDKFFSNLTLYSSKYDYFLYTSKENNQYWNSKIGNLSLKDDFTLYILPESTFRFGFELNSHYFNPGNLNDEYFEQVVSASSAFQSVIYTGFEKKFSDKFMLNASIRGINWNNTGPATIYSFNENYFVVDTSYYAEGIFHSYFNIEPQVELLYAPDKSLSYKLSFNRHIQYINLLSNSVSPFTTLDVWMPAGPNIKPQEANQFVLGLYKKMPEIRFTAELFYKKMYNQIDYANHPNMYLNPYIEGELRFGSGEAYGAEFFLTKTRGLFTGWLGYSYIRSFRTIKDVNNNERFPTVYDKPHYITLNLSYKLRERWQFNMNWVYSSGIRFSAPTSFYYYRGQSVPVYTEKNNAKLPDYHRMDISVSFRLNKNNDAKYAHRIMFSVYNLYARENPVSVNFNKIEAGDDTYVIPSDIVSEKQLLPTQIYLFGMIPSLSYTFKFK